MKNISYKIGLLCVSVCALLVLTMSTVLLAQISHQNYFSRSDLNVTTVTAGDGNIYNKVSLADLQQMDELGKPYLPVKYVKLIVPSDQDVEKVVIKDISKQVISGTYFIFPAQPPIPTSTDYQKSDFIQPDFSVYNSDEPYPSEIVRVVHDGYFDGCNHIITLAVYPLQYKPKSGRLVFFSSIDFEPKMKHGKMPRIQGGIRSKKNQQIYDAILEKIVDNPRDIPLYRVRPSLGKAMIFQSNPLPSYEYVIITNNALKDKFEAFVSWKKRKGLDIGIVTMEQITANYTRDEASDITDAAGALRQYLCDSYYDGNPKTIWALLAGDHTIVPVRYGCGGNDKDWDDYEDYSYWRIPAHLYFEDFNGDWDVDGTDDDEYIRYGEPTHDSPDYNPEIFVGRLPCTNEQDIKYWIDKLFKYELKPGNGDDSYLIKCFWVSADEFDALDQPESVMPYYPSVMTHDQLGDGTPATTVVSTMSQKYGILNWYCHGFVNAFKPNKYAGGDNYVWTPDDGKFYDEGNMLVQSDVTGDGLDNMTNEDYPAIVYSVCCEVCAFDDFRSTDTPGSIPHGKKYPTD